MKVKKWPLWNRCSVIIRHLFHYIIARACHKCLWCPSHPSNVYVWYAQLFWDTFTSLIKKNWDTTKIVQFDTLIRVIINVDKCNILKRAFYFYEEASQKSTSPVCNRTNRTNRSLNQNKVVPEPKDTCFYQIIVPYSRKFRYCLWVTGPSVGMNLIM